MMGGGFWDDIELAGYPKRIPTGVNFVTAGYLGTLGVPILSGRDFTAADVSSAADVAIVSEDIAKQIGRSPWG